MFICVFLSSNLSVTVGQKINGWLSPVSYLHQWQYFVLIPLSSLWYESSHYYSYIYSYHQVICVCEVLWKAVCNGGIVTVTKSPRTIVQVVECLYNMGIKILYHLSLLVSYLCLFFLFYSLCFFFKDTQENPAPPQLQRRRRTEVPPAMPPPRIPPRVPERSVHLSKCELLALKLGLWKNSIFSLQWISHRVERGNGTN